MNIQRLEQNKLHKLFLKCFPSVEGGARILGYTDAAAYRWIAGKSNPQTKKMAKAIQKHRENIDKLEKELLG